MVIDRASLKVRTKTFSHRCVKLAVSLPETVLGHHLRSQLIRCSTSVAANYRAACLAQTKAVFVAKLSIVVEEIDESLFWIDFIIDEKIVKNELCEPLRNEANELTAIFIATRKTASINKLRKSSIPHHP